MAKDRPTVDKGPSYQDFIREDRGDCLPCRIIGGGAFLVLGAYTFFSGHTQLEKQQALILKSNSRFGIRSRRLGITGISLTLAWMGLWRIFN